LCLNNGSIYNKDHLLCPIYWPSCQENEVHILEILNCRYSCTALKRIQYMSYYQNWYAAKILCKHFLINYNYLEFLKLSCCNMWCVVSVSSTVLNTWHCSWPIMWVYLLQVLESLPSTVSKFLSNTLSSLFLSGAHVIKLDAVMLWY